MNPEVKQKWVRALRSGEYNQTQGALQDRKGFCCLGVLCDISGLGHWDEINDEEDDPLLTKRYITETDYRSGYLPYPVVKHAEVENSQGGIVPAHLIKKHVAPALADELLRDGSAICPSALNDRDVPFSTIADIIEEME